MSPRLGIGAGRDNRKILTVPGAYHAAKACPSPSAHARDVWANTARMAVPAEVVVLVVLVFPGSVAEQAVAADLARLGGLRGISQRPAMPSVNRRKAATSSSGLRWPGGFVEGDVDEGPAVVEPERGIPQPGGLGLVQLVVDRPHQLLVDCSWPGLTV
jgi:hypothetical protein